MIVDWNVLYSNGRDYSTMNQRLLDEILRRAEVKEGGTSLDVGCGTGDLAVKLAQRGFVVMGIDLSQVAIAKAIGRSRESGTTDNTSFLEGYSG
jgi:cyclopropane fatty-acyl-phospholipid synthase-like methyltransferase